MEKIEVEKHDACSLPHELRARIIEECRKRAKPGPFIIVLYMLFAVSFGAAVIITIGIAIFTPQQWYIAFGSIPFGGTIVLLTYIFFIRPRKILELAEKEDYTYYMGVLTDKKIITSTDSDGDTTYTYYLYIDGVVRCVCDQRQYNNAAIGNRYVALYFQKKKPEICLEVT